MAACGNDQRTQAEEVQVKEVDSPPFFYEVSRTKV